jgi:serine/threonine-protein kinase
LGAHDLQAVLANTLDGEQALPSPSAATAPLSAAALGSTLPPESVPGAIAAPKISVGFGAAARDEFPVSNWEHYEFLKLLGRGGMGAVYKARDKRLHRTVALKFIRGADPNLVMRFMQEARAQARIDHPQVCKVYEIGEVQGHAYIAMQYVDGKSLDSSSVQLSLTQKVVLMRQVAEAMHEAHKLGIIHRELSMENLRWGISTRHDLGKLGEQ